MTETPTRTIFHNRNFLLLFCAYATSALGDHLSEMALLASQGALDQEVDITPMYARMTFLFFLPWVVFGPVAGVLADRLPRRLIMVASDLVRCAIMFSFPFLLKWSAPWGSWGAFFPLLVVGVFAAFFSPARNALLPTLVHPQQLMTANAMLSGLGVIATMVATKLGGFLADQGLVSLAFNLDALTFLASAMLVFAIRVPAHSHEESAGGGWNDLKLGIRYVRKHRKVLQLILVAGAVWGCGVVVRSTIPAIVRDVYHGSFNDIANYQMFLGFGMLIGAIVLTWLGPAMRNDVILPFALMGLAASVLLFAISTMAPLAHSVTGSIGAVGVVLAGATSVAVLSSVNSLLQSIAPDAYRGRVMSLMDLSTVAAVLLATGFLGIPHWPRLDRWVAILLLLSALILAFVGVMSLWSRLKRFAFSRELAFWCYLNAFVARGLYGFQRMGRSYVPRTGPVIVTANHTSSPDPMFLYAGAPYRPLAFMIAREYASPPILGHLIRLIRCIPVKRDGQDVDATKAALRLLKDGGALCVFIEGTIPAPGQDVEPKDGVAMLALRTGVPVIPAYISGTVYRDGVFAGFFARHRARIRYGPAVDLSEFANYKGDRDQLRAATVKIFQAIKALGPRDESDE